MINSLESSGRTILELAAGIPDDEARWRPEEGRWSVLEVVCHLVDEERDDFRMRLRMTLEDPTHDWPPIDPPRWAVERDYNARSLAPMLEEFARERAESLRWLRSLESPKWENRREHPIFGGISAGDLLASWAAHDLLHLRQITNIRLARVQNAAAPFSTAYALP